MYGNVVPKASNQANPADAKKGCGWFEVLGFEYIWIFINDLSGGKMTLTKKWELSLWVHFS